CAKHFDELCATTVPLRPGAADLLKALRDAPTPMAVATSTAGAEAHAQLEKAGVSDNFAALVTRSNIKPGKPHPETFLRAAELLKVDPSNCLALEDSHNGVRAAAAAGM